MRPESILLKSIEGDQALRSANLLLAGFDSLVECSKSQGSATKRGVKRVSITLEGSTVKTDPYMAPELHLGTANPSPASDIYSLGVLIYQLTCRSIPNTDLALFTKKSMPQLLSPSFKNLLQMMLRKDAS